MQDESLYDLVQMTGIDTWTALSSGAYVLAENYLYTREALVAMYEHLEEGGIIQIVRLAKEMESLRMESLQMVQPGRRLQPAPGETRGQRRARGRRSVGAAGTDRAAAARRGAPVCRSPCAGRSRSPGGARRAGA